MKFSVTIMTSEESFINNYGAALQGYALFNTVKDLGYKPVIVRYKGGVFEESFYRSLRKIIGNTYRLIFQPARRSKLEKKYLKEIKNRKKYFQDFQDNTMTFYNNERIDWKILKKDYPISDIYLCGSDQIWNPYFKGNRNDLGYFLAFAPEGKKKISYAPSFGSDDLPAKAQENLGSLLADFSSISVREKSGIDIVEKYAGRKAEVVLDPTLLCTPAKWDKIAKIPENIPEKYILCYRFAESDYTKSMIDKISEALSISVISLPLSSVALSDSFHFIFNAGPNEFIGLIKNATLVCTDSFHATVFSILMNTPVCVFLREYYETGSSMNSRIFNLLSMLDLETLIQNENSSLDKALSCLSVDYTQAYKILEIEREKSLKYLHDSLER